MNQSDARFLAAVLETLDLPEALDIRELLITEYDLDYEVIKVPVPEISRIGTAKVAHEVLDTIFNNGFDHSDVKHLVSVGRADEIWSIIDEMKTRRKVINTMYIMEDILDHLNQAAQNGFTAVQFVQD